MLDFGEKKTKVISSRSFSLHSCQFSMHILICMRIKTIVHLPFYSFSSLFLALFYWLRSPVQCSIKVARMVVLALFLILHGKHSLPLRSSTLAGGFLRTYPTIPRIFISILKLLEN